MSENQFPVRVGVKAVITCDDHLLVIKFDDETGPHYNLPGGGVESGEDIESTLQREVHEETTAAIEVGSLLFVLEYFPPQHDERYGSIHKLELFFSCELCAQDRPQLPVSPDPHQIDVEWLSLDNIENERLLPPLDDRWRKLITNDSRPKFVTGL